LKAAETHSGRSLGPGGMCTYFGNHLQLAVV
jgi:hypothetical protein